MRFEPDRAVGYPARWDLAVAARARMDVLVPVAGPEGEDARRVVAAGSGIVGWREDDGRVDAWFEGWVHGAFQYAGMGPLGLWEAGVRHAAGRALTAYPTVARAVLPAGSVVRVGEYAACGDLVVVDHPAAVLEWATTGP